MEFTGVGLILKAAHFAAQKHQNQRRKGLDSAPYINHPLTLANLLWNQGEVYDEVVIAAALLHDTVEDTATTFEELEQEFGAEVRAIVAEVTDDKNLPKEQRKQLQIDHAPHLSSRARLVKIADKIANFSDLLISPPENWSMERKLAYFQWGYQVVNQIRGSNATLEARFDEIYEKGVAMFS